MPNWPRSLRGRTLMLTVVGIIACECVTFVVLGVYRHTLLSGRARDFISGQVEMVRSALTHATPEQVAAELDTPPRQRLGRRSFLPRDDSREPGAPPGAPAERPTGGLRAGTDRLGDPFAGNDFNAGRPRGSGHMRLMRTLPVNATADEPSDLAVPQVLTALRDDYGADALRFTDEPEPAVWVSMPSGWWLMLPFSRYVSPPVPWFILFATLAAVAVMGGLVGIYSFHLSKPLRALSDAAANYRVGQRPELPLSGPDEIRAVTVQFNAMAERLDRDDAERRVMLAGLPHDLRAPLARARLRLELMDDGPDSPKAGLQRDMAEVARIADQFVAYLRGLDDSKAGFERTALHEVVRDRGLVWRESGHDITIGPVDTCHRNADVDALMRAIDNLIGNAFTHGGVPVHLSGELHGEGAARTYRITVRDHGPGIPRARRAEAIKPFTRLDAARGASGHCGLGLAVAQSVAKLHGGQVRLDDAAGGGLAAAIVLPAA